MQGKLTVITTTHLTPSDRIEEKGIRNPNTDLLEYVYENLTQYLGKEFHWIISLDFKNQTNECKQYRDNIQKYIETLPSAELLLTNGWRENMTEAKNMVKTPYFLFWEHDWVFNSFSIKKDTVSKILKTMDAYPNINHVRFNKRSHHAGLDRLKGNCTYINDIPLIKMGCWSNNPHICRTSFWNQTAYPTLLKRKVDPNHLSTEHDFREILRNTELIDKWGVYLYGDTTNPPSVRHLDGNNWTKK